MSKRREDAQLLINAVRRNGWRIYATVVIEGDRVPAEMIATRDKLEGELLMLLADLRDPEYRARHAAKAEIGNARTRATGKFVAWLIRRLTGGEQ